MLQKTEKKLNKIKNENTRERNHRYKVSVVDIPLPPIYPITSGDFTHKGILH